MSTTLIDNRTQADVRQRPLTISAYLILLIALPVYGFWQALLPVAPAALIWLQIGMLVAVLAIAQSWPLIRPLRGFVLIALVVTLVSGWLVPFVGNTAFWTGWFGAENPSFWQANSGGLLLKLASALTVVAVLLMMGLDRAEFFLVKGQLDAPAAPVRWLGIGASVRWTGLGRNFAILTFFGILAVTLLPNLPRWGLASVARALPLSPAALLFAAANAIYEEIVFRAAFLSQLVGVVGRGHSLVITILFFGLAHWVGSVPSGIVGVLLAAFFALIMGKAMLETRGITWPWICHFAADAAVFIFLAVATSAAIT